MSKRTLILALAFSTLAAVGATAQPGPGGHGPGGHRGPGGPWGPGSQLWESLAADFDSNQDGRITLDELGGAEATFEHLDRDGDDVLTEADFERGHGMREERMENRGLRREGLAGGLLARAADGDGDATVTSAELESFLAELDADADGLVNRSELHTAFDRGWRFRRPGGPAAGSEDERPRFRHPFDRDQDGELEVEDFRSLFAELDANGDGQLTGEEVPRFRHRGRG